ncbi:MAG: Holliday junction branch migration protein RuvA [Spirochaetales bacterium]|nr:MAG: Holliday junction branch migration protein RuvA [Spirochaetales bacterium]
MFNSLSGTITYRGFQSVCLETGGIEWDIAVTSSTALKLPAAGEKIRILTWLYHREDAMKVYGFLSEQERDLFLDLLKITGIGPKQALKILSGIGPEQFITALDAEDVDALARVPGLGKKTASKIVLSMRGKLTRNTEAPGVFDDIVDALTDMGFERGKAQETVRVLAQELKRPAEGTAAGNTGAPAAEDLEKEIFKRAIIRLSNK